MTNRLLKQTQEQVFCGNYKRTQQEVPTIFLHYLYDI